MATYSLDETSFIQSSNNIVDIGDNFTTPSFTMEGLDISAIPVQITEYSFGGYSEVGGTVYSACSSGCCCPKNPPTPTPMCATPSCSWCRK